MLGKRLPILKDVYETYILQLPANALYPTTSEIFRNPIVQDIINDMADFTKTNLEEDIVPLFKHIIVRWRREIEDKLHRLITDACGADYSFDPEKVLQLATTLFSCDKCYQRPFLSHPRVVVNSCATEHFSPSSSSEVDEVACFDVLCQSYWNSSGAITFNPENLKLLTHTVQTCGFDPKTTTSLEMDEANPILECVPCNDVRKGRAMLKWSAVVAHKHKTHPHSEMKLELLEGQEADFARARMSEEQERKYAGQYYTDMICMHRDCKKEGNTIDLMQHAMRDHCISKPTREDIVPRIDSDQTPALVYLWPPRVELKSNEDSQADSDFASGLFSLMRARKTTHLNYESGMQVASESSELDGGLSETNTENEQD